MPRLDSRQSGIGGGLSGGGSLARVLTVRLLACVVPLVAGGMAVHAWFQRDLLVRQFDESLVDQAMTLATLVVQEGGRLEVHFADEYMPQYARTEDPAYFQIRGMDGMSLERSWTLQGEDLPFRYGTLEAPVSFVAKTSTGAELRCVGIAVPARLPSDARQQSAIDVVIVHGRDAVRLDEKLALGLREVALTGLVSIASIVIFVVLVLRRGMQLLRGVVSEVEEFRPGALDRRIDMSRVPGEIRPIVASLDAAMKTIHSHVERERRFTADVAHELRTPIAELRMSAELAQKWPEEETRSRAVSDAHEVAIHMGALVESLLELATLEGEQAHGAAEYIDLSDLVRRSAVRATHGRDGGPVVDVEVPERLELATHPRLWDLVLRNLLDNALDNMTDGGRVRVTLSAEARSARLRISNPTESIDAQGVSRCTERLWRSSRGPGNGRHFGLGLSIVQAACARMGHVLRVELEQGTFHATVHPSETDARPDLRAREPRSDPDSL